MASMGISSLQHALMAAVSLAALRSPQAGAPPAPGGGIAAEWAIATASGHGAEAGGRQPYGRTAGPGGDTPAIPGSDPGGDTPAPPSGGSGAAPAPGKDAPPSLGAAPAFSLQDIHGSIAESSYASRPVTMVHFWASWCVPCVREIPELNRLASTYEPSGAAVFAIAISSGSAGALRQVAKAYDIRHRVLVGDEALVRAFGGISSYPTTFLVDGNGRIVERHVGGTAEVHKRIEASLRALILSDKRVPRR